MAQLDMTFSREKKTRVIIDTDAKNEADDQYAIVHALLTPSFELHGIIPAHFGTRWNKESLKESREEVNKLLQLMGREDKVRVEDGAPNGIPDEYTPVSSPGSQLIIREALKDDPRPLYIACYGPLTNMASALLLEPQIEKRNLRVVWAGGGPWPQGGREYNLSNDIHAANIVFRSQLELWQIPSSVYRLMPVGYAELMGKVYPHDRLGQYLVKQTVEYNSRNMKGVIEYRPLADSTIVGVIIYPECGRWEWRPACESDREMHYLHTGRNRPIRVYDSVDARFILEDFFAKLAQFASEQSQARNR